MAFQAQHAPMNHEGYSVRVAGSATGTETRERDSDFFNMDVRRSAAKRAPNPKRITGPKLLAAAMPTK